MDLFAELDERQAAPAPAAPAQTGGADLFAELDSSRQTSGEQGGAPGNWMDEAWGTVKDYASDVLGNTPHKLVYDVATGNFAQNPLVGRAMSGMQGATFGGSDEAIGALGSLLSGGFAAAQGDPADIAGRYRQYRDLARSIQGKYAGEHPLQSTLYEFAGAIAGPGKLLNVASRPATGLGRLALGVGIGAGEGAVAGAGYAPELEDVPGAMQTGAGWGAAAAGLMPVLAPVISGTGQLAGSTAAALRRLAVETPDEAARRLIARRLGGDNIDEVLAASRSLNGQGMLADTSMEARRMLRGLQAEYPDANIMTPVQRKLDDRQMGMVDRLRAGFNRATGEAPDAELPPLADVMDSYRAAQREATQPLYQQVDQSVADLTDDALAVLRTKDGRRAYDNAARIAEAKGVAIPPLEAVLKGDVRQLSGQAVDYVKQGLDTLTEAAKNERSGTMENAMRSLTGRWLGFADNAIPDYAKARQTHAMWRARQDALDLGSKLMNSGLPAFRESEAELVDKIYSLKLSKEQTAEAIDNLRNDISQGAYYSVQNRLGSLRQAGDPAKALLNTEDATEKLRYAFGESVDDVDYSKFLGDIARESEYAATRQMMTGGSPTQYIDAERSALQQAGTIGNVVMSSLGAPGQAAIGGMGAMMSGLLARRVPPKAAEEMARVLTKQGWGEAELADYLAGKRTLPKAANAIMNRYQVTGGAIPVTTGWLSPDRKERK